MNKTPIGDMIILGTLQREVGEWTARTFPQGDRSLAEWQGGPLKHLRSKVRELDTALAGGSNAGEELADIVMLCLNMAHQQGIDLGAGIVARHVKNQGWTWDSDPGDKGFRKYVEGNTPIQLPGGLRAGQLVKIKDEDEDHVYRIDGLTGLINDPYFRLKRADGTRMVGVVVSPDKVISYEPLEG